MAKIWVNRPGHLAPAYSRYARPLATEEGPGLETVEELSRQFLGDNDPARVLVNSVPKSGTTWTRRMMASLPGYTEFPMDGVNGQLMESLEPVEPGQVFHGHIVSSPRVFGYVWRSTRFRTIYVYRDLRDVVVSDYHHRMYLNPNRAPAEFATKDKDELFMPESLMDWCGSAKRFSDVANWIARMRASPAVKYEDLKRDGVGNDARRLWTTLGFTIDRDLVAHIVEINSFARQSGRSLRETKTKRAPLRKGASWAIGGTTSPNETSTHSRKRLARC